MTEEQKTVRVQKSGVSGAERSTEVEKKSGKAGRHGAIGMTLRWDNTISGFARLHCIMLFYCY